MPIPVLLAWLAEGRLLDMAQLRARALTGGLDPSVRQHAWPLLLGLTTARSTTAQRAEETRKRWALGGET